MTTAKRAWLSVAIPCTLLGLIPIALVGIWRGRFDKLIMFKD